MSAALAQRMPDEAPIPASDIVDAVFAIDCARLPVDHAWALSQAIRAVLPWFADEPRAGLHTVHGAASGSGWMRPEGEDALIELSRRTRLVLRLPRSRVADAGMLRERTLDVDGHALRVRTLTVRPLARSATLFARSVLFEAETDEAGFVDTAREALGRLGVKPTELLCGREVRLATPERSYRTRSLMLAGLPIAQAIALQEQGLGIGRALGCGVFIPHKGIADVRGRSDFD